MRRNSRGGDGECSRRGGYHRHSDGWRGCKISSKTDSGNWDLPLLSTMVMVALVVCVSRNPQPEPRSRTHG